MSHEDDPPKPPKPAPLDETAAPDAAPDTRGNTLAAGSSDGRLNTPALEATLAAGTSGGMPAAVAKGSVIRPPSKPLTETLGDSDADIVGPEERVDRYVLKKRLGAGGMGVVYKASDSELGRDVAIKMIKSGASSDRLKREAQAMARLDHRNVVTVYDVGDHEGRVWVAMELVDGVNLHQWSDSGEHTTAEVMRVLLAAADGIIAAHAAGIIHRDLKPDNIFVANDGNVLVGDFGIARDANDDDGKSFDTTSPAMSLTQTGNVLGTPAYMAPEQAEGEASEKSDQFSFCVTAYEALYGTRPFPGTTFQDILDRVDSGEIEAPKRRRKVPAAISRAIRRGLSADPSLRFGSMRELVAALQPRPRSVWPWITGAAALAVVATIGIVMARREMPSGAVTACSTQGNTGAVWNAARRGQLVARLKARGLTPTAIDEIAARLDDYAARWSAQRRETCLAEAHGQLDVHSSTARSVCHALALAAFADTVQSFETDADMDSMTAAKQAASLPSVEGCASEDAIKLAVASAEHEKLMQDLLSWRTADLTSFEPLRTRAAASKDLPAQLEIALTEAKRALDLGSYVIAEAALQRGMPIAEQLDASGARARLLALAAQLRCAQNKDPESYLPMAEAAGKRLDPVRNATEVTAILEARAACLVRATDPAPAIPILEALIARAQDNHATALDEITPRSDLALVYRRLGRNEDAAKQEAIVLQIFSGYTSDTSALGEEASNSSNAAFMAGDLHGAIAHQLRATPLYTQPIHKAQSLGSLAMYYDVLLDWKSAIPTQDEVIRIVTALPVSDFNDQLLAEAYVYAGWDRLYVDDVDGAQPMFDKGLPLATKFDKTELIAVAQLGLGRVWLARKEYARAVRFTQDGLATHAKLGDAAQFRVAIGLYTLAQAQWALDDKHAARESAQEAEVAATKGLDQARNISLGSFGLPFKQSKLDEMVRWREAHK